MIIVVILLAMCLVAPILLIGWAVLENVWQTGMMHRHNDDRWIMERHQDDVEWWRSALKAKLK